MKKTIEVEYQSPQELLALLMAYVAELSRGNADPQIPGVTVQGGGGGGPP